MAKGEATFKNDPKAARSQTSKKNKTDSGAKKKPDPVLKTETLLITKEGYLPHEQAMPPLKRGQITTITVRLMPDPAFKKTA